MKFVTIREFRNKTAAVREDLQRERDIVLTANGRPFALLSAISPDNVEEDLLAIRNARARQALDRIRASAKTGAAGTLSMRDIDAVIAEVRAENRAKTGTRS